MMWKDSADKINDKYISVGPDNVSDPPSRISEYRAATSFNFTSQQRQYRATPSIKTGVWITSLNVSSP